MPEWTRPDEQFLDLPEAEGHAAEPLDHQMQRAQDRLATLKREQETLEQEKRDLEELGRRRDQLQQGKAEMVEKFTRTLVVVEREYFDAQKRVETLDAIRASFAQHLDFLDAIDPKFFESLETGKELIKALGTVDDARAEYSRALPKIGSEKVGPGADAVAVAGGFQMDFGADDAKDFTYWLKAGFAFTLPLFAVGVILVIVLVAVFNR